MLRCKYPSVCSTSLHPQYELCNVSRRSAYTELTLAACLAGVFQGLFEELQSKLLDVSEEHQRSLSVALERLSNAMCKAKMLVARWANNQGANKLIRAVGRSVKNKMDIQDLRDVSA